MPVVVVNAPGATGSPHWSLVAAAALCNGLAARAVPVTWLRVIVGDASASAPAPAPALPGVVVLEHRRAAAPLPQVAAANEDTALELTLVRLLRPLGADAAVVHLGAGAGGSPNVLWLADRLGLRTFAGLRFAELVCARGDLRHRTGTTCSRFDDAEWCRRCCASGWRKPHQSELQNRFDLLLGSLLTAERVVVDSSAGEALLRQAGLAQDAITVAEALDQQLLLAITSPAPAADGSRALRSRSPRSGSRS
ncbi:MAG: hypothetical protein JNN13_03010 [Planctomycetes bacterium]|nr:hypothetical protein [Planctomycetota bacterium]